MSKVITTVIDEGDSMLTVEECEVTNVVCIGLTSTSTKTECESPHMLSRAEFYDMIKDVESVMKWTNVEGPGDE